MKYSWAVFFIIYAISPFCLANGPLYGTYPYSRVQPILSPFPQLSIEQKPQFYAGRALATQPWIEAPATTTARDGLGPLFNARRCTDCHVRGLRGKINEQMPNVIINPVVKLSSLTSYKKSAHPYGEQIQTQVIGLTSLFKNKKFKNSLSLEAELKLEWSITEFKYPDGTLVNLRKPSIKIVFAEKNTLPKDEPQSLRNAPVLYGAGLLEMISEAEILQQEDPEDKNKDGISGRANWVEKIASNQKHLGRFGWKARHPDVMQTLAAAFAQDMGIRSSLFPLGPCSEKQTDCLNLQKQHHPDLEISDELLQLTDYFVRHIAAPKPRTLTATAKTGETLFQQAQCSLCHRPQWPILVAEPETNLPGQQTPQSIQKQNHTIWPYTDMLLHDMGEGLADGREEYLAKGNEWRTPPLWGLSQDSNVAEHKGNLLHDGRARTLEEAILWHGGEAEVARQTFIKFSPQQRAALLEFLRAL
jgi:CxxC motif-containing protein (DUF1111 family)